MEQKMAIQPGKDDLVSKLVQEIAIKGGTIPERHILKDHVITPAIDAPSEVWQHTLLIDYSLISSPSSSSSAHRKELLKLYSALKDWGCFQVINHQMTSSFLEELLEVTKEFFALPVEEKLLYSVADDFFNGYGNANQITGRNNALNWSDRLFLTVFPEDHRKLEFWPEKPNKFRDILNEYSSKLRVMLDSLLKAMARSLELDEDGCLAQHGDRGQISTRFGIYPPCPCPDQVYGVSPHSDESTFTILLQDIEVPEGLHILKDQWYKVPVIPGALFINLGDFAEVMSNGIFKSVVHRVVTNPVKERVSVAAFCTPEPENDVEPIAELITSNRPKMYNKVNKKLFKQIYLQAYPQGKKVVDALKV